MTAAPQISRTTGDGRREANAATVLRTVLDHGPVARRTIAQLCGLSPAAVSRQCTDLVRLGLVRELPELVESSGVGRPQIPIDLHTGPAEGGQGTAGPVAGGIHIGVPASTFGLMDLRGGLLARRHLPHDGIAPGDLPRRIFDGMRGFLDDAVRGRPLLGVGAALGGWVDPALGTAVRHDALGWHQRPLAAELARGLGGIEVRIDNHARAIAQSEILFGRPAARRSLVHLFVGNVVDAALGIAGVVHQGPGSGAGDVAHLPVPDSTVPCACGRTGCLEATASNTAIALTAVRRGIVPEPDVFLLVDAAAAGDRRADRLLRERARAVGRAAALLLDVLNPDLIVVTEHSSLLNPEYLEEIRGAAVDLSHVCGDPERIVSPHAGTATLPVAAGTILLNPLFRRPLATIEG
ncbi:Sugar kinase of the NBD/HSP70 family, may contain an N-terminal HTH domain [Streptomyces sp. LamerLS-316]|uniref:ROK family transcriptional regulator n=1 Tax=unclassified Streptomyces TaxID=2593676 RepID=UPI000823C591|nr:MULTISPECIES: ROK family transcriptional regulator [unclassified Streptomyces]MYQ41094.1 ROK family protein [Streptomyces sp. SID4921]SCK07803.1 Sugar kinase of the NBD/HSP70 family, may contain an N-terminal HTH domain [Streptomyces sp. LamerLS-316]